jgi:hypothetical protein
MNQNQDNEINVPQQSMLDEQYSVTISRRDLELLFKYLARTELKGAEVPELNKVVAVFDPQKLKKL